VEIRRCFKSGRDIVDTIQKGFIAEMDFDWDAGTSIREATDNFIRLNNIKLTYTIEVVRGPFLNGSRTYQIYALVKTNREGLMFLNNY
jgi:hypothetical protein